MATTTIAPPGKLETIGPPALRPPALPAVQFAPPASYRFTVDQYHQMIDAGILATDDRAELLDGQIVVKMTQNAPHVWTVRKSEKRVGGELPEGWCIRPQVPVTLEVSEPEPDLSIVRGSDADYAMRHPSPADIGALIDVADATLLLDRKAKGPVYAAASIAAYWIINLVNEQVEVYEDPTGPDAAPMYRRQQTYRRGESVPLVLDGKLVASIAVDDLLPQRPET